MHTKKDTFSITDLRHNTSFVLKEAMQKGFVYLLRHSKPEAALVNLDYLNALQEAYEDSLDAREFDRTVRLKRLILGEHKRRRHSK